MENFHKLRNNSLEALCHFDDVIKTRKLGNSEISWTFGTISEIFWFKFCKIFRNLGKNLQKISGKICKYFKKILEKGWNNLGE